MTLGFVFVAASLVFCLRDALLLATRKNLLLPFVLAWLVAGAGCGLLAETLSVSEVRAWLGDFRMASLWPGVVHLALGNWCWRRSKQGKAVDWISLLPAPVCCIGIISGSWLALTFVDGATGLVIGLLFGAAYGIAASLLSAFGWMKIDSGPALRTAAIITYASSLLLAPAEAALAGRLDAKMAAWQMVDWRMTGIMLACVSALVGASFLWHRFRSNRPAATSTLR